MTEEKVLDFAKSKGLYFFDAANLTGEWNGYAVFLLEVSKSESNEPVCTGLPQWVLVSDKEMRLATADESMELLSMLEE